MPLSQGAFLERLAIATALGLFIGLERQWRQRTAGLHTSTLVAAGSALFASLPLLAGSSDSIRVAAQIVSGVGFLAGGVILREGFNVRGLITAATLWSTAAVGTLAGSGFELEAAVGAGVIIAVNLVCMPLADLIARIPRDVRQHIETLYTLRVRCEESARTAVRMRIRRDIAATSLTLISMSSSPPADGVVELTIEMSMPGEDQGIFDGLQASLLKLDGVVSANWQSSERTT